nr:hypothetical protein [Bacillus licheniformis]
MIKQNNIPKATAMRAEIEKNCQT